MRVNNSEIKRQNSQKFLDLRLTLLAKSRATCEPWNILIKTRPRRLIGRYQIENYSNVGGNHSVLLSGNFPFRCLFFLLLNRKISGNITIMMMEIALSM